MDSGTIAMRTKQNAAATDKTTCLAPSTEHYPNVLMDKTLGEDGQVVFGRQCASRFHRTYVLQVSKESRSTGAEVVTKEPCPVLNHETNSP